MSDIKKSLSKLLQLAFIAIAYLLFSTNVFAASALTNGVAQSGISGGTNQFYIFVPAGQDKLVVTISGASSGDPDLFVNKWAPNYVWPTSAKSEYQSRNGGTTADSVTITAANGLVPNNYYVFSVEQYSTAAYVGLSIKATYSKTSVPTKQCANPSTGSYFDNRILSIPDVGSINKLFVLSGEAVGNCANGVNIRVRLTHPNIRHLKITLVESGTPSITYLLFSGGVNENGNFTNLNKTFNVNTGYRANLNNTGWKIVVEDLQTGSVGTYDWAQIGFR